MRIHKVRVLQVSQTIADISNMAAVAAKNGDLSKPLLPQKYAASADELAGHRESAIAYLIRCAARFPV